MISSANTPEILVIGDFLIDNCCRIDRLPQSGEDKEIQAIGRHAGGSAANTCYVLSELGIKAAFCGNVGDDAEGRLLYEKMHGRGVDMSCASVVHERTGFTLVLIDAAGERTMLSFRGASASPLSMTAELEKMLDRVRIVYATGYMLLDRPQAEFVISVFKRAYGKRILTALDPSPVIDKVNSSVLDELLNYTYLLMPNASEVLALTEESDLERALDSALDRVPAVLLKQGASGARLKLREGLQHYFDTSESLEFYSEAEQISPVDTTGAGDSFNAAFFAGVLREQKPGDCLVQGNLIAGKVISGKLPHSVML